MISRTSIGRSFGGVVRYQFAGRKEQPSDKQAEVLAAVGVRADSAAHMSADFNRGRQLNPNLGHAVWHTSLSFNPDDAATLDSAKMLAVAEGYVQKMGLDKTQYAIIRHHDQPDNQHLHIIANRVGDDGQTVKDGQNFYRSKQALKELIQEHGLTPPRGLRADKQHPAQLQGAELTKHELRQALHQALATAPDRPALLVALQAQQISAREFANKSGEVTGISFEKDGTVFKGSQLGRGYSLAGITQQLAANQAAQQAAQEQAARHRQEAGQLAQRQEAEQQAAQAAKGPELPAVERKWQADYRAYTAELAQRNAPIQARNKIIDSYSAYLQQHPNEAGIAVVVQAMKGDPRTAALKAELDRQVAARATHAKQWADSYGQQAALEKQAEGGFFGKNAASREAEEKLKFLTEKDRPLPGLLAPALLEFARAAKAADRPAPAVGFAARAYYQPEHAGLSLTEYAAKREAERRLVVRVHEPVGESQAAGRAAALQRSLTSKGATVSARATVDAQGNRVIELAVQYSVQQPRHELKDIGVTLDWAADRKGYEVQERAADRAQRQAPGQREAQQAKSRTQGPRRDQSTGIA
ncbi:relaxase/mobilization nuclease domain-containing protein [Hymenobacter monticola]|uniref:Relaxase/mobilization nuclease domain-containing protein n=1 Tax=Hymenobacter monticola TaxID=1705399 RepID=A0ABY4BCH7_9BACT|nr:relaxase/mobilization nuclease domain-containing protein [Hymenobacter monticola]UOE36862.1 relaxase/mobilization nuclease domain-containing protein [Hymenobacter monticola]